MIGKKLVAYETRTVDPKTITGIRANQANHQHGHEALMAEVVFKSHIYMTYYTCIYVNRTWENN